MTKRSTFTEAELRRAISAADKMGKVAVQTPTGIAFVDPSLIKNLGVLEDEVNPCDIAFGVA